MLGNLGEPHSYLLANAATEVESLADLDRRQFPRVTPRERRALLTELIDNLVGIYDYFKQRREEFDLLRPSTVRRSEPKVGRNDPCPCSSGEKYKNCCFRKMH